MQTTIRIPDETIEKIEENLSEDQSRSDWIRGAIREKLESDPLEDRVSELERRLDQVEYDLNKPWTQRVKERFTVSKGDTITYEDGETRTIE